MWHLSLTALIAACGSAPPPVDPVFVRGGVIAAAGAVEGRPLTKGRVWLEKSWAPGRVEVGGATFDAPLIPQCVPLFSVPLGDVSKWVAMGAEPPDTAIAFDADGDAIAVGTWAGEVRVLDGWTGAERARLELAETLVKRVAWSADGRTLYAAEQSTDAWVVALDRETLATRHRLRLADHVESSAPPDGDDLYGVYTLPAAYALEVLDDGDLLVVATHGWNDAEGVRQNRARVLRTSPELVVRAAWPREGAADAVILSAATSGGRVAVSLSRSATSPPPADLPIDGVQLLDLQTLTPAGAVRIPPLEPWFQRSFVWEALVLDSDGGLGVGLGDGRLVHWREGADLDVHPLGTPIELGDVAIAASVGQVRRAGERYLALTAGTNIPFGSAHPDLRPPQPHPNENALFALRHGEGGWTSDWTWRGPHQLSGLTLSDDGKTLVVGSGARSSDGREDLFGALVFDLEQPPEPVFCPTSGPVFFRQAISHDGRVAVAEHPWRSGERVQGQYQLTVLR